MTRYDIAVTVNFPEGMSADINAAAQSEFGKLGEMIEFALTANGIAADAWSSLVVTVVRPQPEAPKKATLRVVQ